MEPSSHLLLLPPDILFEILQCLNYRALIHARQTCKALYEITNSEQFWIILTRKLCFHPDFGNLIYPLGNYSGTELRRWALRRLRAQDRWAFDDPSQPLQFRSRLIDVDSGLYKAELLRGGRWLFTTQYNSTAHILDLEMKLPRSQFLFDRPAFSKGGPLIDFQIWIDETNPELLFRVATYSWNNFEECQVCIYQIHCTGEDSSFAVMLITVVQDYPHRGRRFWTALSEKFFLQCFIEAGETSLYGSAKILQLHRYHQDLPHGTGNFVERHIKCTGPAKALFIPGDRILFAASTFIDIYLISLDQDSRPLKLVSLHHFPISQATLLSAPFIGSHCAFLVSIYNNTVRRITIKNDRNSPPELEELGNLELPKQGPSFVRFGPLASIVSESSTSFKIITYGITVGQASFGLKWKQYNASDELLRLRTNLIVAAFEDSIGRILVEINPNEGQLMILDLI